MAKEQQRKQPAAPKPSSLPPPETPQRPIVFEVSGEHEGRPLVGVTKTMREYVLPDSVKRIEYIRDPPCEYCAKTLGGRGKVKHTQGGIRYVKCDQCGHSFKITLPHRHLMELAGPGAVWIEYRVVAVYEDAKEGGDEPPAG